MNVVIMLAALTMVKNFIATVSGFIGASDANKVGESTKGEIGKLAAKAGGATLGAASISVGIFKATGGGIAGRLVGKGVSAIKGKISDKAKAKAAKFATAAEALKNGDIAGMKAAIGEKDTKKMLESSYRAEMAQAAEENKDDPAARASAEAAIRAKYQAMGPEGAAAVSKVDSGGSKLAKGLAVGFSVLFGAGQIKKTSTGQIDATGTAVSGLKAAGNAILDIGSSAIKFTVCTLGTVLI